MAKKTKRIVGLSLVGALSILSPTNTIVANGNDTIELLDSMEKQKVSDIDDYKVPVIRAISDVNIRKEPNTECEILGTLRKNEAIRFVGHFDGWYEVFYNNSIAFINDEYVKGDFDIVLENYDKLVYINTDTEIYKTSSYSNPIGQILTYECAEIYGATNGFYIAKTNDYVGYIPISATSEIGDRVVVVDISDQELSLYYNNKKQLTTPVVTGKPSTPTYIGLYYIYYKEEDTRLTGDGYDVGVDVWMPFNGGIGLHDASWRYGVFGGDIYTYDGSHGCVNLPTEAAHEIYNQVDYGTPVLVKQ